MRRFLNAAALFFAAASALLLCLAMILPLPARSSKIPEVPAPEPESGEYAQTLPESPSGLQEPEQIASIFGWVRPAVVRNPEIPKQVVEPAPEQAAWLSIIGEITPEGEGRVFYVKNTRNGTVFKIGFSIVSEQGWQLLEDRESELLLENQGSRYIIQKR